MMGLNDATNGTDAIETGGSTYIGAVPLLDQNNLTLYLPVHHPPLSSAYPDDPLPPPLGKDCLILCRSRFD